MNNRFQRLLGQSPLTGRTGQITLGAIIIGCFIPASINLRQWLAGHPLVMLAAMAVALALYAPTMLALWFLDRRDRAPWPLVLLTITSVIMLFGPLAAFVNDTLGKHLPLFTFVGLNEELVKVATLLLLVGLVPRAVNGTRDGLVYGALGGLGFALIEFGYYAAFSDSSEIGWPSIAAQIARANLLGTHNHILWSATLGAAIGWAAVAPRGWRRIAVPLASYIAVALNHSLEDVGGNAMSAMLGGTLIGSAMQSLGIPETAIAGHMTLVQILFGTINVLMINIIILPVLLVILLRSGATERQIIHAQSIGESDPVVSPAARESMANDRWLGSRTIAGLPRRVSHMQVALQNELAFHKAHVARTHGDADADPAVIALRVQLQRQAQGLSASPLRR